jgi:hypothetical protein
MADRKEKGGSWKKAIGIGALGLALIAGAAYKFLWEPFETKDNTDKGSTAAVVNHPDGNRAAIPPASSGAPPQPEYPPARESKQSALPPDSEPAPAPDTMVARLLNPIRTSTSSEGDQFQAKLENGPYRGQILTGAIKKLSKSKKKAELELELTKLNGEPIPMKLELASISNSQGVKGVDDENNRIEGQSSKRKIAIVTAIGTGVGVGFGKLVGKSGNAAAIGAGGGGAYLLSVKLSSRSKDIELNPGSQLTLRASER